MIPAKYWSPTKKLMVLGAMAGGKLVEDTATGNPLTFITDKAKPLRSLLIPFTPRQSGTGDPSPQNVRPIVPWNGLTVFGGGKNLFDESTYKFVKGRWISASTGEDDYNSAFACTLVFVPCEEYAGMRVTLNKRPGGYNPGIAFYTSNNASSYISGVRNNDGQAGNPITFTIPVNAKYMRFTVPNNTTEIQIEAGSTATAYEPYKPIPETDISFPSPVYGGTLDVVSGVLTVEWVEKVYTGAQDELWNTESVTSGRNFYIATPSEWKRNTSYGDLLCNVGKVSDNLSANVVRISTTGNLNACIGDAIGISTVADFRTWLSTNNMQVAVKLATPSEIELTPTQLTALIGDNTIWSDADGSMTAVYLKKG